MVDTYEFGSGHGPPGDLAVSAVVRRIDASTCRRLKMIVDENIGHTTVKERESWMHRNSWLEPGGQTRNLVLAPGDAVREDGANGGNDGKSGLLEEEGPPHDREEADHEEQEEVQEEVSGEGDTFDPPEAGHGTTYSAIAGSPCPCQKKKLSTGF